MADDVPVTTQLAIIFLDQFNCLDRIDRIIHNGIFVILFAPGSLYYELGYLFFRPRLIPDN